MEALLLGIYAFFVWLIFIKFKWLPWNTTSQVTVVIIPIVAMAALILTLNVVAPSTADVRVIKYVVQVIPQVRGRVIEVPVEPNRLVKKGELLFRIDPTQYQNDLNVAKAKLAADEAKFAQAGAGLVDASAGARQLQEQLKSASGQVSALQPRLELARLRVRQNRELVATGAGDKFALEQAEANVIELEGQIATARANEAQVTQKLSGQVNGEQASVAAARAQLATAKAQVDVSRADLANAQWNLDQTSVYAPANGYAINVQLRPGSFVTAFPVAPAMSFVEETYQVIALYAQNELRLVEPGNDGGVHAQDVSRAASSRRRSTPSSGRRARARWRSRACCRRPAPIRRCRAGSRSSSTSPSATASCSSPPARTARARSTPSTCTRSTSCAW